MDISFEGKDLRKYANDDRLAVRKLGSRRAELFKQRLDDLRAAETLEDVRHLPGRYHELKNNRKGQWACDLDQPYRLIFEPHENPVPETDHGQYIWLKIRGVEIVEIENYHKEG
ncbi:type II toxin-antitoxin system RelE/ParE family toxin [Pelodictyon phaeoclathratiforme]|jgi:proteic killer suppression protein|uniref:Plasmid maintenance system killer n=1 Tax=Pelodictyon phaeoclathratiforme (strain DSM 5477 / BU-1) TaxID=324925 RepID=B4SAB2_PELPB|nr:type II toxin-antitoxin system RelE/ParE family toxin [Pelodictyon phaeoclathratiforme]ACF43798.1 plasmid maintenance system killer [Pelodictyon phaeoclathratiforme BU-1]MBV5289616.1 type II toxin-antitoxin system RelE/ParE family toxin [Pelodictyon phaeoclathratiforme]